MAGAVLALVAISLLCIMGELTGDQGLSLWLLAKNASNCQKGSMSAKSVKKCFKKPTRSAKNNKSAKKVQIKFLIMSKSAKECNKT